MRTEDKIIQEQALDLIKELQSKPKYPIGSEKSLPDEHETTMFADGREMRVIINPKTGMMKEIS